MNADRLTVRCLLTGDREVASRIAPLFWQHGESGDVLREEMRQMRRVGIGECIVESRPHPDYLGDGWWQSLDAILDEAAKLDMRVWFFDDGKYPSGFAGGRIREKHPHLMKVYLSMRCIEACGPLEGASFRVQAWVDAGEQLVAVVAGRRIDPEKDDLDPSTLIDLTDRVDDGRLHWNVPEGWWRVYVLVRTRQGGEQWTRDYLNPLLPQAVDAYIAEVHEEHFKRYSHMFGNVIAGFFTDEPRFGNASTYDAVIGRFAMVLPWSDDLLAELDQQWPGGFRAALPTLWHDAGELAHRARYHFMDIVSRRFGENFTGRIGRWCRDHGVRLIGHVVEDNNAHARLGFGAGHFFRALQGQDMSGLDLVYQVWPGLMEGQPRFQSPFGVWDLTFFYWGIAKMASSYAHLDATKNGMTMCEIFGAYGWQFGLTEMKWLTDHACVRGVNYLVPHAFSPKYPDDDCPPHFYARGANPQWRHFHLWSAYANRVCHLLSDGRHVAPVAVLYHAQAEWAGECELFHHAVGELARRQIDCDVVPIDFLIDDARIVIEKGAFSMNGERFACLVVPCAQRLPVAFLRRIVQLLQAGVKVVFTGSLPESASDCPSVPGELSAIASHSGVTVCPVSELAGLAAIRELADFVVEPACPQLRIYRYKREGADLLFCVNEDPRHGVDAVMKLREPANCLIYDAMQDTLVLCQPSSDARGGTDGKGVTDGKGATAADSGREIALKLAPFESLFLVLGGLPDGLREKTTSAMPARWTSQAVVEGPWKVSLADAQAGEFVHQPDITSLCDLGRRKDTREFAGIIAYETTVTLDDGEAWLDLGQLHQAAEVFLDGKCLGAKICPPHLYCLGSPGSGKHNLRIEVATTLLGPLGDNPFDRAMPHLPTGLLGPVRVLRQ